MHCAEHEITMVQFDALCMMYQAVVQIISFPKEIYGKHATVLQKFYTLH